MQSFLENRISITSELIDLDLDSTVVIIMAVLFRYTIMRLTEPGQSIHL